VSPATITQLPHLTCVTYHYHSASTSHLCHLPLSLSFHISHPPHLCHLSLSPTFHISPVSPVTITHLPHASHLCHLSLSPSFLCHLSLSPTFHISPVSPATITQFPHLTCVTCHYHPPSTSHLCHLPLSPTSPVSPVTITHLPHLTCVTCHYHPASTSHLCHCVTCHYHPASSVTAVRQSRTILPVISRQCYLRHLTCVTITGHLLTHPHYYITRVISPVSSYPCTHLCHHCVRPFSQQQDVLLQPCSLQHSEHNVAGNNPFHTAL
jgi:hypothetical protein